MKRKKSKTIKKNKAKKVKKEFRLEQFSPDPYYDRWVEDYLYDRGFRF